MALSVAQVQDALRTTTGTQDFTVTGLGSSGDIAGCMVFATLATANGTPVAGECFAYGFTDGTTSYAGYAWSDDAEASASDVRRQENTGEVLLLPSTTGTDDDIVVTFDSFITDGVRLSVDTTASARAVLVTVVIFAGSDVSAKVGTWTPDADSWDPTNVTVGFEARFLAFATVVSNVAAWNGTQYTGGGASPICLGFAGYDGSTITQAGYHRYLLDNDSNFRVQARVDTDDAFGDSAYSTNGTRITAITSTYFTADPASNPARVCYFAVGGFSEGVQVGTFTSPTSTGTKTVTTTGIDPGLVGVLSTWVPSDSFDTAITSTDAAGYSLGWGSTVSESSTGGTTVGEGSTSDTESHANSSIVRPDDSTGATGLVATVDSLGTGQFSLDYTTADATGRCAIYIALEGSEVGGGGGGGGAMSGTAAAAFSSAASALGAGALSAVGALALASVAALAGAGSASAAGTAGIAASGTLAGSAALSSSDSGGLTGSGAGTLAGAGALSGAASCTIDGTLTTAALSPISGAAAITAAATGALAGAGELAGVYGTYVGASGSLGASGALSGAASGSLAASGAILGAGALTSAVPVYLGGAAVLEAAGALQGSASASLTGYVGPSISTDLAGTKTINVTNPSTHARTGLMRTVVPFALGEVADEASLQGLTVNWRGVDVPTFWTAVGAPHRDGSVRYAQAEWRATIPGDGAATRPTIVAQVVERPNTPPTASFPLATVFSTLGLTVSYTDPENGQSYSADILARARAGTNNATHTTTDLGGRRLVRAEGYMGRGQHYEARRVGGWNTSTAAVLTDGNLHVRTWWEFGSGDAFGTLTILFSNDAAYPTPSQPLDGSGRNTPTNPGVLDDPLQRHLQDLRVTFDDPTGTLHFRSWWTDAWAEGHGRGMWGRTQAINGTGFAVWSMPIEGLAADQSWGVRFSFARSAGEAAILARHPYAHQGMPTQETWRAAVRSGSLPGSWSSDSISISGGWMFPLIEVDQAQLDAWFQRGPTIHGQVMTGSIHGTLGSANRPNLDPWNLLGAKYAPSGGSTGRNYGGFQEGAIHLTGSPWELYYYVGAQLREFTARHGWIWGMEHQPRTWVGQPSQETVWYKGSALRPESFNRWGRYTGANDQNAPRPQYNGTRARDENPQAIITYGDSTVTVDTSDNSFNTTAGWLRVPEAGSSIQVSGFRSFANNVGTFDVASATATKIVVRPRGTQTLRDGETPGLTIRIDQWPWNQFDSAHHGIRPLALVALWTQDPVFLDLVDEHGREQALWYCEHTFSNTSAGGESWRSNWRPLMILYHAWLVTGDSYFADSAARRINQWIDGPVSWRADVPGPPHPGPSGWVRCVGTFKGGASQLYQACDGPPETRVNTNTEIAPWQHSLATPFLLSLGFDFSIAWGTAAERAVSVVHSSVRAVLMGASAINPTRISAAAAGLLDACWGSAGFDYRRTLQPRQSAPDLTTDWGWCRNQLVADYGGTHGEFFNVLASLTNWIYSFGSGNAGENTNHNFTLETYKAFADLRADAGLVERADFLTAGLRSFFPRLLQGADYDSQFGFAIDSYLATNDPPTVAFTGTPLVGNAPLEVAFDATASRIPSGTRGDAVARWWFRYSPGDEPDAQAALGTAEAILTPTWTYATAGTFTVRLEIEDSLGQVSELTRTGYITTTTLDPPVAWIVGFPTSGYAPLEVAFQSTGGGGPPASWAWDFGDGATSAEEHPIHEYTTPGIYDVTLVVTNAAGSDTMTRYEYVTALAVPQTAPVASFTLDVAAGSAPLTVTITNTSTGLVSPSYLWDFGDGEGFGAADPGTHTYTDAGSYTLSLTIVDVGGTSYAEALVVVSASPVSVTVTASPLDLRTRTPAPVIETGHTITPAAPLSLASRIPPPTVTTNLSAVTPVPVEQVHVLYTAAPLTLVSSLPAPAVEVSVVVTPPGGPLALVADLPTPTVSTNTSTSVEVTVPPLKLVGAIPAPTIAVDVTVSPGADDLTLVSGIPTPTVETGRRDPVDVIYTAAPLALAADVTAPAVTGDCTIVPDLLEHFLGLVHPNVSSVENATFTPAAPLRLFGTFPAPTVTTGGSVTVTVEPLALVAAIPDPTVMTQTSTTIVPAPLALVSDVPAPTVLAGTSGEVFVASLAVVASIPAPTVYANYTASIRRVPLAGTVRLFVALEGDL